MTSSQISSKHTRPFQTENLSPTFVKRRMSTKKGQKSTPMHSCFWLTTSSKPSNKPKLGTHHLQKKRRSSPWKLRFRSCKRKRRNQRSKRERKARTRTGPKGAKRRRGRMDQSGCKSNLLMLIRTSQRLSMASSTSGVPNMPNGQDMSRPHARARDSRIQRQTSRSHCYHHRPQLALD